MMYFFFSDSRRLGTILVSQLDMSVDLAYRVFFDEVLELKQNPDYSFAVESLRRSIEFLEKEVNIENWNEDKLELIEFGVNETEIDELYTYLIENNFENAVYGDLIASYKQMLAERSQADELIRLKSLEKLLKTDQKLNYEEYLDIAKKEGKPLLLLFNGYATEMAQTMHEFAKENIKSDRFISIIHIENEPSMNVARKN